MASSNTYIVTGTSRGLGLEFVKQLVAKGETVTATAHNPTKFPELSQLADNKNVFAVKMDVNDNNNPDPDSLLSGICILTKYYIFLFQNDINVSIR